MLSQLNQTKRLNRLSNMFIVVLLMAATIALPIALVPAAPAQAFAPILPMPLCALVTAQVVCYDAGPAVPQAVTPPDQRVLDFAIAPDGNWLAYRSNNTVSLVSIQDNSRSQQIDKLAPLPADIDLRRTTLAWSPDGLTLAYVTANGFRVAFPSAAGTPQFADINDRMVVNLRFSPGGLRLAAQADDNTWTLFKIESAGEGGRIQRLRTVDRASDLAWVDNERLIVAAIGGGLASLSASDSNPALRWVSPGDHFTKLIGSSSGDVFALHPDPGDTIGHVVRIQADGTVTAVGNSKIDAQAEWGPNGDMLYYITSGTPILIDRTDGGENTLPLKRVARLAWLPGLPPLASSLPMDGEMYFLAPDANGVRQVWRLYGSGLDPIRQMTHQNINVRSYALNSDRSLVAVVAGSEMGIEAPTDPPGYKALASLKINENNGVAWYPNQQQIAYTDGYAVYLVATDGNSIPISLRIAAAGTTPVGIYRHPQFSPDGHYLSVELADGDKVQALQLLDLRTGMAISQDTATWKPDSLQLKLALAQVDASWQVAAARFAADQSLLVLRRLGWQAGPNVLQLYVMPPGSAQATPKGRLNVMSAQWISPTGRFAAGLIRLGKLRQLIILELQSGHTVRIQGAIEVESLEWIS